MAKRGENIRKRADGRWEARFFITEPDTMQKKYKSIYAKTYDEVKIKLGEMKSKSGEEGAKVQSEIISSPVDVSEPTIDENILLTRIAAEWLMEVSRLKKHSTYIKYKEIYNRHLAAALKGITIMDINENRTGILFEPRYFLNENLSNSLVKSIYCVINQILNYCNIHYYMNIRPMVRPKLHVVVKPVAVLSQAEQIKLLHEIYNNMDNYNLGILICLSTGLRLGEICSLKWSDIDLEGRLLYVNRTVQRIAVDDDSTKTMLLEDTPKSMFSKREIPLPDSIMPYLTAFMREEGYVISEKGSTEPRTYQYRFQRLLVKAGIEKRNFHTIRHTFATNCINSGADIKSLSEILGHSNVNITLNRYVHPTIDTKRKHLNNLSSLYSQYAGQKYS